MATSRNKINAVLYTGFNALTSRARYIQHNRHSMNRTLARIIHEASAASADTRL
jgi:hypothetical protein